MKKAVLSVLARERRYLRGNCNLESCNSCHWAGIFMDYRVFRK